MADVSNNPFVGLTRVPAFRLKFLFVAICRCSRREHAARPDDAAPWRVSRELRAQRQRVLRVPPERRARVGLRRVLLSGATSIKCCDVKQSCDVKQVKTPMNHGVATYDVIKTRHSNP